MNSDGDKFYIKIVDLDKIYKFVVQIFYSRSHLEAQIINTNFRYKFNFWSEHRTTHIQKFVINLYELIWR